MTLLSERGRSFAAACGLSSGDEDEELIEGLSFPAYHRVSTVIFVPGLSRSSVEMVTIDPLDLQAAQERDAAMPNALLEDGVAEILA